MSDAQPQNESGTSSPFAAYIAPFAAFLVVTQLESLEAMKPYYPWVYFAKIAIVTTLCIAFRKDWPKLQTKGFGLAILVGIVGVVAWVAIAQVGLEKKLVQIVPALESLFPDRVGFNPFQEIADPIARYVFLAARFFGLALIVPIIEEVFWRGFLMRYLIDDRKWENVPMGTFSSLSFLVVTILFALVHPEFLAAIVWGAGINLLLVQTRNLWATIVAHGVTNLLLGLYILQSGAWKLW
jgi:CAAX prenyl protease-like protein